MGVRLCEICEQCSFVLRVQVIKQEAVAENVKRFYNFFSPSLKPQCGKCASQPAVVWKRASDPGTRAFLGLALGDL